jgi:hypothetical protein
MVKTIAAMIYHVFGARIISPLMPARSLQCLLVAIIIFCSENTDKLRNENYEHQITG